MANFRFLFLILIVGLLNVSCQRASVDEPLTSQVNHPEWSKNANIYEVNIRQFTPEGTFSAFAAHLDRLQEMGVDILWFMPITPIGELNRKGSLGSYYSVKDYTGINPEFGTIEDFKNLVQQIHARGMYVILDWVANHTAWDHPWTVSNPEFYTRDEEGNFMPPDADWSDVIDLDYSNMELWDAMIGEMRYWVEEINVDGFRCDVAYMVPTEFWNRARAELEAIKPVFMLAEAESPELHLHAFEAGYGWHLHHVMNRIAGGGETVAAIDQYFFGDQVSRFPEGSYKMYFITNHDENSWAGTEFTRLGAGVEAFAVLAATIPGMVLLYNGQEAAFDRMLEFFEKDEIDWGTFQYHEFYKQLLRLKNRNQALWNGLAGGEIQRVHTNNDDCIFAFVREKDNDKVFVVLNLSDQELEVSPKGDLFHGSYTELFSEAPWQFGQDASLIIDPWGYFVFEQ
jgi:cyclomaltodextrinase / maltogenic alpha-amylase / neopullulanase